eukprot:COSAG01_NODE_68885_length_263_cov_0.518293_1_plen_45_part_10
MARRVSDLELRTLLAVQGVLRLDRAVQRRRLARNLRLAGRERLQH